MGEKHLRNILMEKFLSLKKIVLEIFCIEFMVYKYFVCTWCIRPGVYSTLIQIVLISSLDQKTKAPLM
jgi:hypothetical protein